LGNTFDFRSGSNTAANAFFKTSASVALSCTFSNCAVFASGPLLIWKTGDTVASDNNAVVMLGNYFGSKDVTLKTWAQWQALGLDTHSVTNASLCLDAHYRPYAKTPCWNAGAEIGPATDLTGKLFQSRRTVGAYEYVTPQPSFLMRYH